MIIEALGFLNNNKIFWGVTMILLNMGSKYVMADLGRIHEKVLSHEFAKKIIVFSMFFVATRDIFTAFILSVFYVILVDGLMHERRLFSLFPKTDNNVREIGYDEYIKCKEIIALYEKQNNKSGNGSLDVYDNYIRNIYTLRNNDINNDIILEK